MRKLPPLHAVRIFETCAQLLNFSIAARELCLTHSAVSHQIKQLEEWFGQPLFTRHAGGVHLTPSGEILARAANLALNQIESACEQIKAQSESLVIRLAAPSSFIALWLIPRLDAFERTHPGIRLQLQTQGDFQDLTQQRVDALIISADPDWPKGIEATPLFPDCSGPICAPDWLNPPQTPEDLIDLPLLATQSRRDAWASWSELNKLDAKRLRPAREFVSLQLMLEGANAKLGIGIAPEQLVQRELKYGRLIAPLGFTTGPSVFALCLQQSRAQESALGVLRHWLIQMTKV